MSTTNAGITLLVATSLLIDVAAIVTLLRRPGWAFQSASRSKGLWLVLILVGVFVCNIGVFVALWYLIVVDPRVRAMQRLGPGIGFPGRSPPTSEHRTAMHHTPTSDATRNRPTAPRTNHKVEQPSSTSTSSRRQPP